MNTLTGYNVDAYQTFLAYEVCDPMDKYNPEMRFWLATYQESSGMIRFTDTHSVLEYFFRDDKTVAIQYAINGRSGYYSVDELRPDDLATLAVKRMGIRPLAQR